MAAALAALRERPTALEKRLAQNEIRVPPRLRTGDFIKVHGEAKDLLQIASGLIAGIEGLRAEVEPALGELFDPDNSNPKAAFYRDLGNNTQRSAAYLDAADAALDRLSRCR